MFDPYIGVASVTRQMAAKQLLELVPEDAPFKLGIGVGITQKSLKGIQTRHPNRILPIREVPKVFVNHPKALNLIHFSSEDPEGKFLADFVRIFQMCGKVINGIQINIDVPDSVEIKQVRPIVADDDFRVVWQVRLRDLKPVFALALIERYEDAITDILLDVSLGKGIVLNQKTIAEYLFFSRQVRGSFPNLGIGIAGGLSSETVKLLTPFFRELGSINMDAEGKLRDPDDFLDLEKAKAYIEAAIPLYY